MPEYLTEKNLGLILDELFPKHDFIHDKFVPDSSNKRLRPDYRSDERMLIIEFDGDSHYCKAQRIKTDKFKDNDYESLGYKVVRIPYFIQITTPVLKHIFDEDIRFKQRYKNGYIDKKAALPADYCELGIKAFLNDLEIYAFHKDEIIESLKNKIIEKNDVELVIPTSLKNLL